MCDVGTVTNLTLLNGTGYIFDVDDYMNLRMKHRIIGSTVGTSSTKGWSPSESTMPVELTQCETRLLLEQGIAQLVSKKHSLVDTTPTSIELEEYQLKLQNRISEQASSLKAEKLRDSERNMPKILAGKRKKLLKEGVAESDIKLDPAAILDEIGENFIFDPKNALLETPGAHPEPHMSRIIQWPADTSLRYRVFRDFWLRGKFVTAGDAFGADFLIYPGDPLLYHASHIVILLSEPTIKPLNMIAKVRLSVIVNKICILAYFVNNTDTEGEESPSIHYQTVLWEGNRDKDKPTT